jgi:hypothetical protein
MVTYHPFFQFKGSEEASRSASVLGRHDISGGDRLHSAASYVPQIADRGGDQAEFSVAMLRHYAFLLRIPDTIPPRSVI